MVAVVCVAAFYHKFSYPSLLRCLLSTVMAAVLTMDAAEPVLEWACTGARRAQSRCGTQNFVRI